MKKFVCLLFVAVPAIAGQLSLQMENDFLFHDDSDYTHGTRIEYRTDGNLRFGVQQLMYTPLDLRNDVQIEGRHPYAGYLAGFAGKRWLKNMSPRLSVWNDLELQLGVLGPSSGAEQTQKFMHKLIGSKNPAGWNHQLKDEPEIQLSFWRGADILLLGRRAGWCVQLAPEIGGLFGTLQTGLGADADLKFGYCLAPGAAYNEIRIKSSPSLKLSTYTMIGIGGKLWLRNELLDGNAHYIGNHDTLTVDKEPATGCIRVGIGLQIGKVEAKFLVLFCTREYKTQESPPHYGSFSIGFEF